MFVQPGFFIGWNDFAQIKWTSQTILYFCKPCSVSPSFSHSIFSVLFLFFFFHSPPFIWNAGKSLWKHDITWHLTVLPQCRMVFLTICIQDGVDKVWGLSESDLGWGMGCFSLLSCFIDSSVPQCDLLTHGVLWRMVTSSLLLSWLKKALTKNSLFPPSSPQHSTTLWPSLLNTQFCLYPDTLKLYSLCSSLLYPRIKVLLIHRNGRTRPAFFFQKRRCKRL